MKEIHLKPGESAMIICDGEPTPGPTPTPTPTVPDYEDDPSLGDNVELRLYNKTGRDISFTGKFSLYIKQAGGVNVWDKTMPANFEAPDNISDGWPHWEKNSVSLKNGEYKSIILSELVDYIGTGQPGNVNMVKTPIGNYTKGNLAFVSANNDAYIASGGTGGIPAIKLGYAVMKDGKYDGNSPFVIHVTPVKESASKIVAGRRYNLLIESVQEKYL